MHNSRNALKRLYSNFAITDMPFHSGTKFLIFIFYSFHYLRPNLVADANPNSNVCQELNPMQSSWRKLCWGEIFILRKQKILARFTALVGILKFWKTNLEIHSYTYFQIHHRIRSYLKLSFIWFRNTTMWIYADMWSTTGVGLHPKYRGMWKYKNPLRYATSSLLTSLKICYDQLWS